MTLTIQDHPNLDELRQLLIIAYDNLHPDDATKFSPDQNQSLDDWFSLKDLPRYSQTDGKLIEVRDDQGKLLGVAYVGKENPLSWPDGHKAKLYLLAVLPENRGQGLGQALIKEAETVARQMGAKMILVDTHVLMEADHRLYRDKMGFSEMGTLKSYYGNGDAIFFGKKLA